MGTDALYRMFAPAAKQFGIGIGVQQGIDIGVQRGIGIGVQQERTAALEAQRQELCSAVKARFGSCPKALQKAFDKIDELNALVKLHIFALTEANSVTDVLERARSARR